MQDEGFVIKDADIISSCRAINKPGSYSILPRANRVLSTLPGFNGVFSQVMATPRVGAHFVEHELLIQPNGGTDKTIEQEYEQFLYVLEGELDFNFRGKITRMLKGGYCWLPPHTPLFFTNKGNAVSRLVWLRRKFICFDEQRIPDPIIANEQDVKAFNEDTYLEQHLIPLENPEFDMAINLLNFNPGVCFGFVESHIMEHGLYMLAGRGIYWLNGNYHEVRVDDFIYIAPYCPQFYYSIGWELSRYLIYKEVNRDYTQDLQIHNQG